MIMSSRVIWSDNGVLKDLSVTLGNFKTSTQAIAFTAAEDYLFIGSDFPFNHRYVDISTANAAATGLTVALWDDTAWITAIDLIDQTSVAGVSLAQSGIFSFFPDDDKGWYRDDTNNDSATITGLTGVDIRRLWWARLSFTNDWSGTLNFIGHKFSDDADLEVLYPDLTRSAVMAQFKSGKTDWKLQHIQAAEDIIKDLKKRNIIKSENQLLNWELFKDAAVHKVAAIAFNAFGKDFFENRDAAQVEFKKEMDRAIYHIDQNKNATLDDTERVAPEGWLFR